MGWIQAFAVCALAVALSGCAGVGLTPGNESGANGALACPSVTPSTETEYVCADGSMVSAASQCPLASGLEACGQIPQITGYTSSSGQQFQATAAIDTCYVAFAINRSDPSICRSILAVDSLRSCYLAVATATGNVSTCNLLGSSEARSCYSQIAISRSNPRVCDQLADVNEKGNCYSEYARQKNDASACELISDTRLKDSCYYGLAMNTRNAGLCDRISDAQQKSSCQQNLQQTGAPSPPK